MLPHLPPKPARKAKPVALNTADPVPAFPPVELRFDGSCPRNPGPMGIGYALLITGPAGGDAGLGPRVLVRVGAQIGQGTNNQAEYHALLAGLRHALKLGVLHIRIVSDSMVVVRQVLGHWKANDKKLQRLLWEAGQLLGLFQHWTITHAYREENTLADELSRSLVYEEPLLPAPPMVKYGTTPRLLQTFQAGLIRYWWTTERTRNVALLARIFGLTNNAVERITEGRTYREATLSELPNWHALADTAELLVYPVGEETPSPS